ncbi:MAG: GntR family transcriptional regulator [Gammaproteobacteria bacterium]|nr:GntR family transcriptional regulator [Gammaproteobacteria bacterium]
MNETVGFRPLYEQIKDLMVQRLASLEWRPGQILPSETKLANEFGVSQGTVRKALDALEAQHLVVRRQGKGTFAARHTPDISLFRFFHLVNERDERELPENRATQCRLGKATRQEQRKLDLGPNDRVIRLIRVRSLAGAPVVHERIVVAAKLFPGLHQTKPEDMPKAIYQAYEREYGMVITRAVERLRAVTANAQNATVLGIDVGTPLLQIDRVALGHHDNPIEWRLSHCRTDRFVYLNELK